MSHPKEISFFNLDNKYQKGINWYSQFFENGKNRKWRGESTPSYLWDEKVPARIKEHLPDAKFLIILRNPVDRAYSAYWYHYIGGNETLSFEQALAAEKDRAKISYAVRGFSSYFDRGLYVDQIKRYLDYFNKDQILILIFEEYKSNKKNELAKIIRFLNIDCTEEYLLKASKTAENVSRAPISVTVHKLVPFLKKSLPLAARIVRKINLVNGKYPPMNSDTRRLLQESYKKRIIELEQLLERSLDSWKK